MAGSGDLPANITINCTTVNLIKEDSRGSMDGESVNSGTDDKPGFRTQHRVSEPLIKALHSAATTMPGFKRLELVSFFREAGPAGNTRVVWTAYIVWEATRYCAHRVLARAMNLLGYQNVQLPPEWDGVLDEAHHLHQQMDGVDAMNASDDE